LKGNLSHNYLIRIQDSNKLLRDSYMPLGLTICPLTFLEPEVNKITNTYIATTNFVR